MRIDESKSSSAPRTASQTAWQHQCKHVLHATTSMCVCCLFKTDTSVNKQTLSRQKSNVHTCKVEGVDKVRKDRQPELGRLAQQLPDGSLRQAGAAS